MFTAIATVMAWYLKGEANHFKTLFHRLKLLLVEGAAHDVRSQFDVFVLQVPAVVGNRISVRERDGSMSEAEAGYK